MALAALILWPIIAIMIFRKLGTARGLIWSTLIGYLFLPEKQSIDLPGLPAFEKLEILVICAVMGVAATKSMRKGQALAKSGGAASGLVYLFVIGVMITTLMTVMANRDPVNFVSTYIPGLGLMDVVTMSMNSLTLVVPFLLARRYLSEPDMHQEIMRALVKLGMIYSIFMLIEVRMSPQFHTWIYGYFQHSWIQHIRGGAFRPIVFLSHGLTVGMFILTAIVAAFSLMKTSTDGRDKQKYMLAGLWLLFILGISRNFGATMIAFTLVPFILFTPRRIQIFVAATSAVLFLAYPAMRQSGVLPLDEVVNLISNIDFKRANSLEYRFDNENLFLDRATERPMTGWGTWGRWRVYDEFGNDISTVDGSWIGYLGAHGWLGYLTLFGLLSLPLFLLNSVRRTAVLQPTTVGLGLIVASNFLYMIPNDALSPLLMMYGGAVMGFIQLRDKSQNKRAEVVETGRTKTQYSRFAGAPARSD